MRDFPFGAFLGLAAFAAGLWLLCVGVLVLTVKIVQWAF